MGIRKVVIGQPGRPLADQVRADVEPGSNGSLALNVGNKTKEEVHSIEYILLQCMNLASKG